ncbi:unnamed protein product [Paramecium pentaurelia]|uniref:Uncharacterized protein n=1 Tax=Paramecium pentaurelia TaxID=43138 RepID=A0A8S1UGN1_9CILI|nr:unnamed protein product [Paramecium pentaurelia]
MYKYCLTFLLFWLGYTAPGQLTCDSTNFPTEISCKTSGYCKWTTTCVPYTMPTECYKINEIGACRSGGVYATPTPTNCYQINSLNVQYENVCTPNSDNKIDYNYVRFPISNTGLATHSLTGITVADLQTKTLQADYLYQVFTVNIQLATNAQLNDILDLYVIYDEELVKTTTHPYYIEKALFQTIQNIRDDTTITPTLRGATLVKFWQLADIFLYRVRTFSKHYQTNYYILNFAQTTFSRLYLTINGQEHTTTFSWTSYTKNGYVQVISYPGTQFGIPTTALSDVYYVKIIDDSQPLTSTTAPTPFTGLSLTVTYIQSGTKSVLSTYKLVKIDDKAAGTYTFLNAAAIPTEPTKTDQASKKLGYLLSGASEYLFYISGVV